MERTCGLRRQACFPALAALTFLEFTLPALSDVHNASQAASLRRSNFRPLAEPAQPRELSNQIPGGIPGITRNPRNMDYFLCNKSTCAIHDQFYLVRDKPQPNVCPQAIATAMSKFGTEAPKQCKSFTKAGIKWRDCKRQYCAMYEMLVKTVTNGTILYHGPECHNLLYFNRTLCEAYYSDSEAFCDCICPALPVLEEFATKNCEVAIMEYLLLGRRGGALLDRYYMSDFCSIAFCQWIEKISDPRKKDPAAPAHCFNIQLPFKRSQCQKLMGQMRATKPHFNPCPWNTSTDKDFVLECFDGTKCDVRVESWACCQRRGHRMRCPRNFPVMCAPELECVGNSDHCCVDIPERCTYPGPRQCSPVLAPVSEMPAWMGLVPANLPKYIGPSTTMSPAEFLRWLDRQPKRTKAPDSWGDDVIPYLPFILIPLFIIGTCVAICVCYSFAGGSFDSVANLFLGPSRWMSFLHTDITHIHRPEDKPKVDSPLPPRIDYSDILRAEAEKAANESLAASCREAFSYGRIHLVSVHFASGPGPQKQAAQITEAIAAIRAFGLQDVGENPRLIAEGEKWTKTLAMETMVVNAMEEAFPCLTVDFRNLTPAPMPGTPWKATSIGHAIDQEKRSQVWKQIEDLGEAVKIAREGGASDGLIQSGNELIRDLIARTPELPADRCVLDPAGKGVKVLPKGTQRAMWTHTGDSYLFDPQTEKAGELNDFELPPRDALADSSVDPSRPVCATWAKLGKCKVGKRCPWRHCKPIAGDTIRECIFLGK